MVDYWACRVFSNISRSGSPGHTVSLLVMEVEIRLRLSTHWNVAMAFKIKLCRVSLSQEHEIRKGCLSLEAGGIRCVL